MIELLVEKYRPIALDEYLGTTENKQKFQQFIDEKNIPHMLLYGEPGTGKDSIAKILINKLEADYLYINASDENNIETVRHKIKNFATSVSFSNIKIIVLTEADYLTKNAQAALRFIMEDYSKHTRFILTCNYINKIEEAIISRSSVFEIAAPTKVAVAKRIQHICDLESIKYDIQDIVKLVNLYYSDIRRIINELQRNVEIVNDEKWLKIKEVSTVESDYKQKLVDLLLTNDKYKFITIRKFLASNSIKQFNDIYSYFDKKITDTLSDDAMFNFVIFLQDAQYQDGFVLDKEINFMSFIAKLIQENVI